MAHGSSPLPAAAMESSLDGDLEFWAGLGNIDVDIDWSHPFCFPAFGQDLNQAFGDQTTDPETGSRPINAQPPIQQLGPLQIPSPDSSHQTAAAGPTGPERRDDSAAANINYMAVGDAASCYMNDDDVLDAERLAHVPTLPPTTYAKIADFSWAQRQQTSSASAKGLLPDCNAMNVFVQLYFEHHHARVPLLHVPTFGLREDRWLLVMTLAAIGCQYSTVSRRRQYDEWFEVLLSRAMSLELTSLGDMDPISVAQSLLLNNLNMMFRTRERVLQVQYHRNTIVTIARQFIAGHGCFAHEKEKYSSAVSSTANDWLSWIESETQRRLVSFTWMMECFHVIFFDFPPLMTAVEQGQPLPCSDDLWRVKTQVEWQRRYAAGHVVLQPSLGWLFRSGRLTPIRLLALAQPARTIVLLTTFLEEIRVADLVASMANISHDEHATQPDNPELFPIAARLRINQAFEALTPSLSNTSSSPALDSCFIDLYNTIDLLRLIPLTTLHQFGQWQTTKSGHARARSTIQGLLGSDTPDVRKRVTRAAQTFSRLRTKGMLELYEPFCLLITTNVIWAYLETVVRHQPSNTSSADSEGHARAIVQIDKAQNDSMAEAWINQGERVSAHITGVGCLEGERTSSRLLKQCQRIMQQSSTRSTLARILSICIDQILEGKQPFAREPVDVGEQ
ncbi:hypothetical protein LTS10_000074 [Elasticomyces elasticus]|nr:hypothetical protein LTS10_000074 [Elasticomyces elasticus]